MNRICKSCLLHEILKETSELKRFEEWKLTHVWKINHIGTVGNIKPERV